MLNVYLADLVSAGYQNNFLILLFITGPLLAKYVLVTRLVAD